MTDPRLHIRGVSPASGSPGQVPVVSPDGTKLQYGLPGTDPEAVRDTIGATLVAGANVTITVDDPGNTITIAAAGGGAGGTAAQSYVGKNAIGASSYTLVNRETLFKKVTLTASGLLTDIEVYLDSAASGNVQAMAVAVFDDNSNTPGNMLQTSFIPGVSIYFNSSTVKRWFGLPIGRWLAAGSYWLAFQARVGPVPWKIAFDSSGTDRALTASGDWLQEGASSATTRDHSIRGNFITL